MIEYLGWVATAVFVGSYFCKRPAALKRVQMIGALMWVVLRPADRRVAGRRGEPARVRRGRGGRWVGRELCGPSRNPGCPGPKSVYARRH